MLNLTEVEMRILLRLLRRPKGYDAALFAGKAAKARRAAPGMKLDDAFRLAAKLPDLAAPETNLALRKRYGLTRAEARLMLALLAILRWTALPNAPRFQKRRCEPN